MSASNENCNGTGDNGIDENNIRPSENGGSNDCGNSCRAAVSGAIPKVKNLTCNIPSRPEDVTKINNNAITPCENSYNATPLVTDTATNDPQFNSLHDRCNGTDLYVHNGVNCNIPVEKFPCINGSVAVCSQKYINGNCSFQNRLQHAENCDFNGTADKKIYKISQDESDPSSDEGNDGEDDHSSDEFCIYTYKGDQAADLPHSFFSLDMMSQDGGRDGGRHDNREQNSRNADRSSSPEMDYLEMDFDPGPSCDIYSDMDDNDYIPDLQLETVNTDQIPIACHSNTVPSTLNIVPSQNVPNGDVNCEISGVNKTCTSSSTSNSDTPVELVYSPSSSPLLVNISRRHTIPCETGRVHNRSGNFHTPDEASNANGDFVNLTNGICNFCKCDDRHVFPPPYQICVIQNRPTCGKKTLFSHMASDDSTTDGAKALPERIMIWSEQEVYMKQILQITDPSSSGATAVCNALVALNIPLCIDDVIEAVRIRLRSEAASVPKYLFSRSCEGSSHEDIIRSLEVASNKTVFARFFPFYPERNVCLTQWLGSWMQKGAIPIITVNLQRGLNKSSVLPDLWHHQMVFGIGPYELYLTNPLEHITEDALWPQITSPPVLLVRRHDVLSRWQPNVDLEPLMCHADSRWQSMNVVGQVANMLRESLSTTQGGSITQHLKIPAYYTAGITLAIRRESPAFAELRDAPDLPLIQSKFHPSEHYYEA